MPAVSSPVLANQLVTGSCRELRSGLPVVRSPNKSMERPLGLFLCQPVVTRFRCLDRPLHRRCLGSWKLFDLNRGYL